MNEKGFIAAWLFCVVTLGFWVGVNIYHVHLYNDSFNKIPDCLVHPFYVAIYASGSMFAYMLYFICIFDKWLNNELGIFQKGSIMVACGSFLTVVFVSLMNVHSKKCEHEMKAVYQGVYIYMWCHAGLSFVAFLINAFILKDGFPFFHNYVEILRFILNHRNTTTDAQIELHIHTVTVHPDAQPDARPNDQSIEYLTEQKVVSEEKVQPPQISHDILHSTRHLHSLNPVIHEEIKTLVVPQPGIVDHVQPPPGLPPKHVVENLQKCRDKIRELRTRNPHLKYRLALGANGYMIAEFDSQDVTLVTNIIRDEVASVGPLRVESPLSNSPIPNMRKRKSGEE